MVLYIHWLGIVNMKVWNEINRFLKEESGQTTTEYFLILAVVVTIFMQFRKKLLAVVNKLLSGVDHAADQALDDMSQSGN